MKKFASRMVAFLTALLMTLSMLPMTAFAETRVVTLVNPLDKTDTWDVTIKDDTKVVLFWLTADGKIEQSYNEFSSLEGNVMAHGIKGNPAVYYILDDMTTEKMNISSEGAYIVGAGDGVTITRASDETSDLLNTTNDGIDLTIMNLTFDGNNSEMEKEVSGGLLAANGGKVTLKNVTFQNNGVAHEYGLSQSSENPDLEFGTGAVRIAAGTSTSCSVIMEDCTIRDNTSLGNGSGIYIGSKGTLTLRGQNQIQDNESLNVNGKRGAGIFMEKGATLNVAGDLTVSGNKMNNAQRETSASDIYVNGNKINVTGQLIGGDDSIGIDDSVDHGSNNIFAKGTPVNGSNVPAEDGESAAAFFRDNCEDGCHVHRTTGGVYFCLDEHKPAPVKYTHTLTYHANDGSTETSADQVSDDETENYTFIVKGCMFDIPDGYTFKGWNEKADGTGKAYSVGEDIVVSESADLYAIWEREKPEEKTVVLTYDANNGTEEQQNDSKAVEIGKDASFTVIENPFTAPEGKEFQEWNTKEDGSGDKYEEGAKLTTGVDTVLYAIWKDKTDKTSYPGLDKVIMDGDGELKTTSVNAGDEITFKLESNVPQDLTNYLKPVADDPTVRSFTSAVNGGEYYLEFHDVMDKGLELQRSTIAVKVNGETVESSLMEIEIGTEAETGNTTINVKLDLVKLLNAGYFTEADFGTAEIILTYTAKAADNLKAGTYTNTAWVEYEGGETEKDDATVKTYGIEIFKYDQDSEEGLKGAEFKLVRVEDEKEITIKSGIISGDDGTAAYEGLKEGTYKLYETKAPEGYIKSDKALTIEIPENVADGSHIANVRFANVVAPHTGGTGTRMYTIAGVVIILAAGLFFVISRKKKEQ